MELNKFINLNTFSGGHDDSAYCALYLETDEVSENIFTLTPEVMRWSDNIWLFHLEPCKSYWQIKSEQAQLSIWDLFEQVLDQTFPNSYICVFSCHPWQSLVFLDFLQKRQVRGVYFLNSLLNQKTYQRVSWENWFAPINTLVEHLTKIKTSGLNEENLRAKKNQLKRFIQRMSLKGPFDLSQADEAAIARRFSSYLGKVWKWTFQKCCDDRQNIQGDLFFELKSQADLAGFPWILFELESTPQVVRHLEYPVNLWDTVEPMLKEDLAQLCLQKSWSSFDKVLILRWEITLYNLEEIGVEISFRHPHSLHEEIASGFKTAMYQARYVYTDLMNKLKNREHNLDLPEEVPFLHWKLKVAKRLYQSPQILNLIRPQKTSLDYEGILNLQNKLSVSFEHYKLESDFFPSQSFRARSFVKKQEPEFSLVQWVLAASKRPFFFYRTPRPIEISSQSQFYFLERTSNNWWQQGDLEDLNRDYFLLKNKKQLFWVYRDDKGRWFQHGIYS